MDSTSIPWSTYDMVLCGLFVTSLTAYMAYIVWEMRNPYKRKPGAMDQDDDFLLSLAKFGGFS